MSRVYGHEVRARVHSSRLVFAALGIALAACARSGLELGGNESDADRTPDASSPEASAPDGPEPDAGDTGMPDTGMPDAGPTGRLEALCDEYRDALCRYFAECQRTPFRDREQCRGELECYGVEDMRDAVAAGRVVYDVERVRACFEEIGRAPCDAIYVAHPLNVASGVQEILAQCPFAITAQQGEGEPCQSDEECVHGYKCHTVYTAACPGTCEPVAGHHRSCHPGDTCYDPQQCLDGLCRLLAREGEACESPLDCREDLDCDASGRCVRVQRRGAGESCTLDVNGAKPAVLCAEGLFCDTRTRTGTCRPLGGDGEHCVSRKGCQPGLFCSFLDSENWVCRRPGGNGNPCFDRSDCLEGFRCQPGNYDGGSYGACMHENALGGPCSARDLRGQCAEGLVCDGSFCRLALFPGDACGEPMTRCVRGACEGGRCTGLRRLGEPCMSVEECASRRCQDHRCVDPTVCVSAP